MSYKEIYGEIIEGIKNGAAETVAELCQRALGEGYPAMLVLEKGLSVGMDEVARKYCHRKVIVPEVLMSARAMQAGLSVLEPQLKNQVRRRTGNVVIGTVAGDLHDIGKNMVKLAVKSMGVRIYDLGIDVTPQKFVQAVEKTKAEILMMASLLTTTMPVMRRVVAALEQSGLRKGMIVAIGGAPVDERFAREIGADCYFECSTDVRTFLENNLNKIVLRRRQVIQEGYAAASGQEKLADNNEQDDKWL